MVTRLSLSAINENSLRHNNFSRISGCALYLIEKDATVTQRGELQIYISKIGLHCCNILLSLYILRIFIRIIIVATMKHLDQQIALFKERLCREVVLTPVETG